ncbi:MAG: DUF6036 family nucleotidyltransferase [Acidimicrobiales bacterium]
MVVCLGRLVSARRCTRPQPNFARPSRCLRNAGRIGIRIVALLGRRELLEALGELDEELKILNVRGEVFIVGGAAMAIAYDTRRSTADVDAVFVPSSEVRTAASRVAERMNLEPDWLNDGAKSFLPGEDENQIGVYEGQHLSVAAASPQYLLAMKLMASRVERDQDDIRELYKLCGLTTAEQGLDLLVSYYPSHRILPRVQFLLQEMFPEENEKSRDTGMSR